MKKLFSFSLIIAVAFAIISCSSASTPTAVAEKSMKCLKSGDVEGFIDLAYYDETDEDIEEEKAMVASLIKEKALPQFEAKKGISSFETISETISKDGETAVVEIETTYGDGSTKTDKTKLIKVEDKWYLDLSK